MLMDVGLTLIKGKLSFSLDVIDFDGHMHPPTLTLVAALRA